MKKNILFIASGVLLALSVGCISTAVLKSAKLTHEVQGASSLPTTVDLNDTSESEIRNYYSYLNNLDDSERRGQNLLKNLKYILTNNPAYPSKTVTYYSYNDVRSIYRITDRNWYSSPASGISGYNSSTKIIKNFDYSSDPYLYYYYRDDNFTNPHTATATIYSKEGTSQTLLNQEHIWSKSHGFSEGNGVPNAGSDLHHLVAADVACNKWGHSNYSYGYVGTDDSSWTSTRTNWDNGANAILNNRKGTPLHPSSSDEESIIFEPRDQDKGDFARALLYMVARYNYIGQNNFTPSIAEPNLTLVNHIISGSTTVNTTTQNSVAEYGNLDDILLFHKADPVVTNSNQDFEVHRNNLIYTNYQHTRNPFIDFPEWVDLIWGDKKDTGVARPQTDTINGYNTVSGYITLSDTSLSLTTGNTHKLTATASNGATVSFSSSNSTVASVNSSGKITANNAGNATITASATIDGNVVTATCTVTVSNPVATVTSVTINPANLSLDVYNNTTGNVSATVNGTNNPPQTVTWTTSNSAVATVSSSGVVTAVGAGNATISATSTYNNSKSGSCSVTVTDSTPVLTSIMVQNPKTTYNAGDTFEAPTVIATYNGNTSHAVTGATFSGYNMVSAGQQTVTVSYTERGVTQTTSYTITVVAADTYTDALTYSNTNSSNSYAAWSNVTVSSPAVYSGLSKNNNSTIQMTNGSVTAGYSGIISTSSGGYISEINVVWSTTTSSNRTLQIYAKNSAYSAVSDLYSETASTQGTLEGTITYSSSSSYETNYTFHRNYQYIGLAVGGGAAYFESISIKWSSSELPSVPVTGFSITPDAASFRAGKSYQLATAFTPVYATNQNVTWTSSNTSVATVSSGLVTGVSSGVATITASTEDGNFVSTCTVSVVDSSTMPYILGLPYKLFINNTLNSKTYYFNGSLSANNYYGASTESYSSSKDIYFEQNGTGYNIYFMNGSPAVKTYIDVTVSGTFHNFSITTSNPNFVWYYETTEGYLYIVDGTTNWRIGGYSTYDTFAVYDASRTNIYDAQYKETVEVFSYYVMNKITCDASGVDTPEFVAGYSWSALSSIYGGLDSSEKSEFVSASAIENSSNIVERAAYRYDYIIWKYGTSSYANFASRSISPRVKVSPILSDSAITIPLLTLGSLFVATSLGIFLTIRKRKEQ